LRQASSTRSAELVNRAALLAYWGNLALLGGVLYPSWGRATRAGLLQESERPEVVAAICRRIVTAQAVYAAGALLCISHTSWSIALIVMVQVNYALALSRGRGKER
jgi:hypothetical protein